MLDLTSALGTPIAKLLLRSWLGDVASDIGMNLYGLALGRLKDKAMASAAVQQANAIANAVVKDLERVPRERAGR
jgi:hypothetical protein